MPENKPRVFVTSLKIARDGARRADALLSLVPEGADIEDAPDLHETVETSDVSGASMAEPARRIVDFARRFAEMAADGERESRGRRPQTLCLVHCTYGLSRSPAAAVALWRALGLSADDACARVRQGTEPHACPERRLLEALDAELGENGALCRAAADHFPHYTTSAAKPPGT